MPSLGDLLRSFADPFGPLLRERIERALPPGSTLRDLALDGGEARIGGLDIPLGPVRVTIARARFQLALLSFGPKAILRHLEGAVRVGSDTIARIGFDDAGRRDAWAAGTLVLTGDELTIRARLEVNEGRTLFRDVRVEGTRGTALEGVVAVVGESLHGSLRGRLFVADLPLAALFGSQALPIDLAPVAADVSLDADGSIERPRAAATLRLHDVPLRPPGQKRFVPHLRVTEGKLVAKLEATRRSIEGVLGLAGGGEIAISGAEESTKSYVEATLRAIGTSTVRHVLDLAGAGIVGWERGTVDGTVKVARAGGSSPRVTATLSSTGVELALRDARFPLEGPVAILEGPLDAPTLAITATLDGGKLAFGRDGRDAPFVLRLEGATPRALARLSLADPSMVPLVVEGDPARRGAIVLPADFRVDLRAEPAKTTLDAEVVLAHGDTRIAIAIATRDGLHASSSLRGTLALSHAATLFSLAERTKGATLAGDAVRFDLALAGSADAPSILGELTTKNLVVGHEGRSLTTTTARARVHVAPRFVAFQDLEVAIGSGFLRGAGCATTGPDAPVARAAFISENIRIGRTEIFPEGAPIDGRAFAHAMVAHGPGGTSAEVRVRLEGPSYPFLPKATARLAKLGLPSLPIEGNQPLEAHASIEGDVVEVRDLRAGVAGLSARGSGEASEGGKVLAADVRVTATSAWLSRSLLLRMPGAVLGSVEVPIRVRGSVTNPETESDLASAIWKSLTRGIATRRREPGHLALPAPGLAVPTVPFGDGSPDAVDLHALANGTLPLSELDTIAARFVGPREP